MADTVADTKERKFRVGEKVCLKPGYRCGVLNNIAYAVITRILEQESGNDMIKLVSPAGNSCIEPSHYLQIYKDPNEQKADFVRLVNKENEMSDVQSDPNKALRELNLDADTRFLRDMGFEDSKGSPQSTAQVEMFRRIWADMRTEVAADLRTAIANEETDKQSV